MAYEDAAYRYPRCYTAVNQRWLLVVKSAGMGDEVVFPRTRDATWQHWTPTSCFRYSTIHNHCQEWLIGFCKRICRDPEMTKSFSISQLAIPAVWALIIFLTFTSQYFFLHFEAAPLRENELWAINILAACIGLCYYRACTVDPGRISKDWKASDQGQLEGVSGRQRWCRRCEAFKPPRAHHCRTCGRWVFYGFFLYMYLVLIVSDVYPKWIITVHGHRIASHILRFRISSGFCFIQLLGCLILSHFFLNERQLSGQAEIYRV